MLHLDALGLSECVDAPEPVLHAGEQHNATAFFYQVLPGEGPVPLLRLPDHGVHIGQNAVNAVATAKAVGLRPELLRRHAQAGDEGIVLHVSGAERLVKVVEKCHDGPLCLHGRLLFPPSKKAAHESRLFVQSFPPL